MTRRLTICGLRRLMRISSFCVEPASKLGKQPVIKTNLEPVQENDKSEGRKQNKVNRKQRIMPRFTLQDYLRVINVDFLTEDFVS